MSEFPAYVYSNDVAFGADIVGMLIGGLPGSEAFYRGCLYSLSVGWDQWAVAYLTCQHGEFRGEANGVNLTEAIVKARAEFEKADHSSE